MAFSDVLTISATILGTLGGGAALVLALSNWLGKVWANRLMEADKANHARELKGLEAALLRDGIDRTRKIEAMMHHYERQIEEFYGPLFNMVNQVFVANNIKWELLKVLRGDVAEKVRDYFHETYFVPLHDEIRTILRSKLYLIEGSEMPESFYLYLKHAAQERDQITLWKRHGIDTSFLQGEPWPEYFFTDIRSGFELAMRNYEDCLNGLKALQR